MSRCHRMPATCWQNYQIWSGGVNCGVCFCSYQFKDIKYDKWRNSMGEGGDNICECQLCVKYAAKIETKKRLFALPRLYFKREVIENFTNFFSWYSLQEQIGLSPFSIWYVGIPTPMEVRLYKGKAETVVFQLRRGTYFQLDSIAN